MTKKHAEEKVDDDFAALAGADAAALDVRPFTPEALREGQPVLPGFIGFKVVHKTVGDLFGAYPHKPISLAESMADYLNESFKAGQMCVGTIGDTTNIYFIFVPR